MRYVVGSEYACFGDWLDSGWIVVGYWLDAGWIMVRWLVGRLWQGLLPFTKFPKRKKYRFEVGKIRTFPNSVSWLLCV